MGSISETTLSFRFSVVAADEVTAGQAGASLRARRGSQMTLFPKNSAPFLHRFNPAVFPGDSNAVVR
jgi:hypothetical protein